MTSKIITEIEGFVGKVFGTGAGSEIKTVVMTDVDKLVAYLKTTTVGTAVCNIVSDFAGARGAGMTGTQKLEAAVADALPIATEFLTANTSFTGEIAGLEDAVRQMVQSTYTDLWSEIKSIVSTILTDLGIK